MTARGLLQAQCSAKRGELSLRDALGGLIGMADAPVEVKGRVKAAWLAARAVVALFPPAIRSAEHCERRNVVPFVPRGARR